MNRLALAALILFAPSARAQTATDAATRGARWGQCEAPAPAPGGLPYDPPGGATRAGTTGYCVGVGMELFTQYALRLTNTDAGDTEWFHAFELTRGHAAITGQYGPVNGRFVFEAVRSASEGALLGVAGDSLVLRVREAYGEWNGLRGGDARGLEFRAGVIPTLTIPEVEGTWRLRAVSPTPLEVTGLSAPADLGLTLRYRLPLHLGWVGAGVYNGDGYALRELNRGKNLELAAALHPLATVRALAPLAVLGSYVMGSSGTGLARADRVTAGLLWQGARVRGGATFTWAWGVGDDGARTSWMLEGFVQAEPVRRLLLGARVVRWVRDDRVEADQLTTVVATAGARIAEPFEALLAVERSIPGARAVQALPGSDRWEIRAVTRVVF